MPQNPPKVFIPDLLYQSAHFWECILAGHISLYLSTPSWLFLWNVHVILPLVVFYRHPSPWAPFTSPLCPRFPPLAVLSCPPALPLSPRYFPECHVANRLFSATRCLHSQTCWLSHGLMGDLSVVSGLEWETVCFGLIRCLTDWTISGVRPQRPGRFKTFTLYLNRRIQIWWPKHFTLHFTWLLVLKVESTTPQYRTNNVDRFVDPEN